MVREKTEKWGKWLFYLGWLIIFVNCISIVMTTFKMVGIIDEQGEMGDEEQTQLAQN